MAKQGLFCLEGDWNDRLDEHLSVRPGLDMLMTLRGARLIHRNASTKDEFGYYFEAWASHRYAAFPVAYLAYHGIQGRLSLGRDELTLVDISSMAGRSLTGRTLYFGSCKTMAADEKDLQRFVAESGAKAVVGYTKNIDWEESIAFDFTLLPELLDSVDMRALYKRLCRRHPHFIDELGLRIATSTWVSPLKRDASD